MKKSKKKKEGVKPEVPESTKKNGHEELKMDYPLSEKDEIKLAEERMRQAAKDE